MPDPNSERIGKPVRRHVRIEVQVGVRFVIAGDPSGAIYEATTRNISRGGICIMAHAGKDQLIAASRNTMPRLIVALYINGDEGPLDISAQTAWISSKVGWFMTPSREQMPVLLGMAFEELSAEDEEKIDAFIEQCLSKTRLPVQDIESRIRDATAR